MGNNGFDHCQISGNFLWDALGWFSGLKCVYRGRLAAPECKCMWVSASSNTEASTAGKSHTSDGKAWKMLQMQPVNICEARPALTTVPLETETCENRRWPSGFRVTSGIISAIASMFSLFSRSINMNTLAASHTCMFAQHFARTHAQWLFGASGLKPGKGWSNGHGVAWGVATMCKSCVLLWSPKKKHSRVSRKGVRSAFRACMNFWLIVKFSLAGRRRANSVSVLIH